MPQDRVTRRRRGTEGEPRRTTRQKFRYSVQLRACQRHQGLARLLACASGRLGLSCVPMSNGESSVLSQASIFLHRVHAEIDRRRELAQSVGRIRPLSDDCLFIDMKHKDYRVSFEVQGTSTGWHLNAIGQDADSASFVRSVFTNEAGASDDGARKRRLREWELDVTSDAVSMEVVRSIEAVEQQVQQRRLDAVNKAITEESAIPAYWWDGRTNFGDLIGPWLINAITGRPTINTKGIRLSVPGLVSVGSVLNRLERPGMEVWGSGLIAPLSGSAVTRLRSHRPSAVHAVRGWKTRKELTSKLGWDVPEVYGDPALLLPRFLSPIDGSPAQGRVSFCPHYRHKGYFNQSFHDDHHVIDVEQDVESVVGELATSSHVISTSLHGIIIAHAYGVPWTWLRIEDDPLNGDKFKFEDFFTVLDRSAVSEKSVRIANLADLDVNRIAKTSTLPANKFSFDPLLEAFPLTGPPAGDQYPNPSRKGLLRRLLSHHR